MDFANGEILDLSFGLSPPRLTGTPLIAASSNPFNAEIAEHAEDRLNQFSAFFAFSALNGLGA